MIVFIELWKATEKWKNLAKEDRVDYLAQMQPTIPKFLEQGATIFAWGHNDKISDYKAEFDYYAVWTFPNEDLLNEFKSPLTQANWYHYFNQVNVCGKGLAPDLIIAHMIES